MVVNDKMNCKLSPPFCLLHTHTHTHRSPFIEPFLQVRDLPYCYSSMQGVLKVRPTHPIALSQAHCLGLSLAHIYLHVILRTWSPCPSLPQLPPAQRFSSSELLAVLKRTSLLCPQPLPLNGSPHV